MEANVAGEWVNSLRAVHVRTRRFVFWFDQRQLAIKWVPKIILSTISLLWLPMRWRACTMQRAQVLALCRRQVADYPCRLLPGWTEFFHKSMR